MSVSSAPRGERAGRPGTTWSTTIRMSGEQVVLDDGPWDGPATVTNWTAAPAPAAPSNRAARRALTRATRRSTT